MTRNNSVVKVQWVPQAVVLAVCVLLPAATLIAQERGPAGTVTLSRTDYDRLLDLASRQPRPPDAAPLPAALTRAEIRARVDAGAVRATMTVNGEVFQTGSVKVPLISNATLLDARSTDRPLPLVAEGNAHVAVVTGPASFSATLEWGTSITASPGRGSFVLPVPPAGSVTATFDVPGEQSDLRVTPGLVLRRTSAAGRTTVEATLDPGSSTQVWWSSRDTGPAAPPRDARLLSDIKTLVTIGDADLRLLSLVDVTVVQGEPTEFEVRIPAGYELAGVTGSSLDRSEQQGQRLVLVVSAPTRRRHQFLINLERPSAGGSFKLETGFPTVPASQRETGEIAVEGLGTLEISAGDPPGLRRMDVREVDQALTSVARQSLLSAYRYQRSATGVPALALDVTRFPDAAVLAAIAERAVATTLVTSEGRALTEVSLWLRNRAQPFMKVSLPPGASMLSVDVAGSPAKPAEGADGMRVPLLRPGFRPALLGIVRLSSRRTRVRQEGRDADGAATNGRAGQRRRMGTLLARAVPGRSIRRNGDRRLSRRERTDGPCTVSDTGRRFLGRRSCARPNRWTRAGRTGRRRAWSNDCRGSLGATANSRHGSGWPIRHLKPPVRPLVSHQSASRFQDRAALARLRSAASTD
jgi:hypothetical protein